MEPCNDKFDLDGFILHCMLPADHANDGRVQNKIHRTRHSTLENLNRVYLENGSDTFPVISLFWADGVARLCFVITEARKRGGVANKAFTRIITKNERLYLKLSDPEFQATEDQYYVSEAERAYHRKRFEQEWENSMVTNVLVKPIINHSAVLKLVAIL